eukprot:9070931-Pyramimonas_sp.AAC.1
MTRGGAPPARGGHDADFPLPLRWVRFAREEATAFFRRGADEMPVPMCRGPRVHGEEPWARPQ